jgi:hypothetical protein
MDTFYLYIRGEKLCEKKNDFLIDLSCVRSNDREQWHQVEAGVDKNTVNA